MPVTINLSNIVAVLFVAGVPSTLYFTIKSCSKSKTPKLDAVLWSFLVFAGYVLGSAIANRAGSGPGMGNPFTEFHDYIAISLTMIIGLLSVLTYREKLNEVTEE